MKRLVTLGLGTMLLAGCAVDQSKEVAKYERVVRIDDQESFEPGGPLSLRQAMLLANQHNESLAISGEDFLQALIAKQRAVASFLPQVNLAPTFSFTDNKDLSPDSSAHQLTVPVQGTVNVFNGFRDVATLRASTATIEQRRQLLLEAQESLLVNVAQVYYQVLRSERNVQVLRNSLRVQEERVRDIRGRQQAGIARPLEVAQTESLAAATRVTLINAINDVTNGRNTLAFLTARRVQASELTDEFPLPGDLSSVRVFQQLAAQRRRDLAAAMSATLAARQNVEVAWGQYYPSVALNLNAIVARDPSGGPDWTGLISANLPLFSGGRIRADVRAAWSRFRQSALTEQQLRRQVVQDVELAYENLQSSRQRLSELQAQLTAAEEAFRQAEQSYNVGLATNLERLTAQDQLLNAQLQLANEAYNQKVFYLNLLRATGGMRDEGVVMPTTQSAATNPAATTNPTATSTPNLVPPASTTAPAGR